ncbi:MAG: glycosyltransferase [Paraburkholderia sp.]|uniref:glycosyltransferase family 4 protein n=1 Tax=Paraburkholderia sp. TaxID=1926495 RepID=UPI00120AE1E7|nr:glycosyltransferase family 4 protein [Paraburkholderia sp.]TAM06240.1 MAG: glycosyltransferase [Paraburkholderia sp.]
MFAWIPHLCIQSDPMVVAKNLLCALHPLTMLLSWTASNANVRARPQKLADADLIILHEYGEPSHYTGAVSAAAALDYSAVEQVEFTPLRKLKQGLEQGDRDKARKALRDAWLLALWTLFPQVLRGKTVILGIAPLDWRIAILSRALRHARIIYHSSWTDWEGARFAKNPAVLTGAIRKAWSNFLTRRVDRFALVTPCVAEQLHRLFKIDSERLFVVFHAYDPTIFHPAPYRPPAPLKVVFAGRFEDCKGVEYVIELARRLPSIEFGLAGDGLLRKSIESAGLPNVTLFGRVSSRAEISSIFMQHHVVVLPSRRTIAWEELFGMVLVEAMACGCIPMATNHTGPSTIVRDAELRDFIFAEEDFLAGAASALTKLERDVDRLRALEQKSIQDARRFALSEVQKIWMDILRST